MSCSVLIGENSHMFVLDNVSAFMKPEQQCFVNIDLSQPLDKQVVAES